MAYWNNEKNAPQTLSDLVRGLQHSVNTAMEMIETRNVELLGRYFSSKGDPITKRLNINEQTAVDVPLISIVNPSTINIKEVEMDFSVQDFPKELILGLLLRQTKEFWSVLRGLDYCLLQLTPSMNPYRN